MIDKNFFRYATYDEYANDKASIPSRAIVFVEDKRIIVTNGKEYGCIGTVSISDLDNWKPASQAEGRSGVYMLTSSYNATSGIMFCFLDSMMHGVHQVVLSNLILNGGKVNDTHMDTGFTLLYRVYTYIQNGSTAPNNWTPWTQINLHDIPAALTAVTELLDNVTKDYTGSITYSGGNLYCTINNAGWGDAAHLWMHRTTSVSPTNATFDIYVSQTWVDAVVSDMARRGQRFRTIRLKVFHFASKKLSACFYAQDSSVLTFSQQGNGWWVATGTSSGRGNTYYRTPHPVGARKETEGTAFDAVIDIWRRTDGTSVTGSVDVTLRII